MRRLIGSKVHGLPALLGALAVACGTNSGAGSGGPDLGASGSPSASGGASGTSGAAGLVGTSGTSGTAGVGGSAAGAAGASGASGSGDSGASGAAAGGAAGSGGASGAAGSGGGGAGSSGAAGSGGSVSCSAGLTACNQSCVDLRTDPAHCGACNSPCTGGRTCQGGACLCPGGSCAPLPAFPGADGAAATVSGGRGGTVYHVTRLDTDYQDITPGTLRYGLSQLTGPRTIVFDVSGVFHLGRAAVAGWDDNGNGWDTASRLDIPSDVTIAGQTAPGPVIVMGGTVKPGGNNIILRNVTFAPGYGNRSFNEPTRVPVAGDFPDSYTYDALDISGQNLIVDHVTAVYGTDETVSMNELANNVTVQYSIVAQGQNYPQADAEATGLVYTGHSLGSLLQAGSNAKISVHHNLYAHLKGRLPRVGTEATALTVAGVGAYNDFRNNVFYNWLGTAGTGASGQASQNNFINNFYLAGPGGDDPAGGTSTAVNNVGGGVSIFSGSDAVNTKLFHAGNLKDVNKDGDANDGVMLVNGDFGASGLQASAFTQTPYSGVTDAARVAFDRVLNYAGASYWQRAALDQRLVGEVRSGTGRILAWADNPFDASAQEGVEWRALRATPAVSRPAGFDSDGDGMPNDWETLHGLNPNAPDNNGDFDSDGYTNLEEYINEIAAWPAASVVLWSGESDTRYARIQNWRLDTPEHGARGSAAYWQPSRLDVAEVRSGRCEVDAVGQHAGLLRVAGAHGQARLFVSSGWLEVSHGLDIGSRAASGAALGGERLRPGAGDVVVSGGRLAVGERVVLGGARGASGVLTLAGGELDAPALLSGRFGGRFEFRGGTLRTRLVGFDLVNHGGTLAPEGGSRFLADLALRAGTLALELGAAEPVVVHGKLALGGALRLEPRPGLALRPGDSFTMLLAEGGVSGAFERVPPGFRVRVIGRRVVVTVEGTPALLAVAPLEAAGAARDSELASVPWCPLSSG